jgi:hypothetical protein
LANGKDLHIIALNIPSPPDYGGVIDIFYKIKYLFEAGYSIHLHAFEYNRKPSPVLEKYCITINYYKRNTGIFSFLSCKPYIVSSRRSGDLLTNLLKDDYPVLFEGLHACYYLDHPALRKRKKLVRMHNIEQIYYRGLASATRNPLKWLYFLTESLKLKSFEKKLHFSDAILAISPAETEYFRGRYGKTSWISGFHANSSVSSVPGNGSYLLMHGNLGVNENEQAIVYALQNILESIDFPVIIAGGSPSQKVKRLSGKYSHVTLVESPDDHELDRLIKDAHIHLVISFQSTGLKLKLINSLFKGRFVIVNPSVISGTGLAGLVRSGKNTRELIIIIKETISLEFTELMIENRKESLEIYSNEANIIKLDEIIYPNTQVTHIQ